MPLFDYKCVECGFQDEYIKSISVPKDLQPPEKCPKCDGEMQKLMDWDWSKGHGGLEFVGRDWNSQKGFRDWKKGKSADYIANVLTNPNINPY